MMNKLLAFIFDALRTLTNPLIISTSLKGEKRKMTRNYRGEIQERGSKIHRSEKENLRQNE